MTRDLDMDNNSIVGVSDIAASNSVVSKLYVDRETAKFLPLSGGLMTGAIFMNSQTLNGLKTPLNDTDAVNRKFVTDRVDSRLALTGGTLTGKLTLDAKPTSALHAASKNYVDDTVSTEKSSLLLLTGGTLTGSITVNGHLLCNALFVRQSFYKTTYSWAQIYIGNPANNAYRWVIGHRADQSPSNTNMYLKFGIQGPGQSLTTRGYIDALE